MRQRRRDPHEGDEGVFRPRWPEAMGLPATAERLAIAEGVAALHRELTTDETAVATACARMFSETICGLEEKAAQLQADLLACRRMVAEAG